MKLYEVTYSMDDIATGGFFRSSVIARRTENIKGLLTETHGEEVSNLWVRSTEKSNQHYEQVLTTIDA